MPQLTPAQKLEKRLKELMVKAMSNYKLIEDDDKILVGLSGGKDSLCLLELLAQRRKIQQGQQGDFAALRKGRRKHRLLRGG